MNCSVILFWSFLDGSIFVMQIFSGVSVPVFAVAFDVAVCHLC